MITTKPLASLVATLLLCAALPALAAGANVARIDTKGCDKPYFPARWQSDADGASVVVGYLIGADGKVMQSKIVESSGYAYIDRASERAGARCRFEMTESNPAAAVWTKVKYAWVVR